MSAPRLDDLFRRAVDLNLRYYGAVGKLAVDYLRDLASVVGTAATTSATQAEPAQSRPAHLLLEGALGELAGGVFLVENSLPQEVQAQVSASKFADLAGRQIQPKIVFDPPAIVLKPGEKTVVKATLAIPAEMEAGVRYTGEIHVPQLQGTRIPVVLRRRP
ncbi:MAG: hypothetical protein ACKV2U_17330 [Bryobacteraceae bacterium]